MNIPALVLCAVLTFVFCITELITSRYSTTWNFAIRSPSLYFYAFFYALIGFFIFLGIQLGKIPIVKFEGPLGDSPYVQAVLVAVCAKPLMQVNLWTLDLGSAKVPLGTKTFVQIFEPRLLRNIIFDEDARVTAFLRPYNSQFADLEIARKKIVDSVPMGLPEEERNAFLDLIAKDNKLQDLLQRYLRFAGVRAFTTTFVL